MRNCSRILLSLTLCAASAPALAGMAGPMSGHGAAPMARPMIAHPPRSTPPTLTFRPQGHPPHMTRIARSGPEVVRGGWRRDYPNAYLGASLGYFGTAAEAPPVYAAPAPGADQVRPRAVIYNVPPPLAQGDPGYVAQPVIYNVDQVLRDHPFRRRTAVR